MGSFSDDLSSDFESIGLNVFSEAQTKSTFKDEAKKEAFKAGAMGWVWKAAQDWFKKGWKWFKAKIRPVEQAAKDKMHELAEKIKEAANKLKVTVSEFLAQMLFCSFYHNQAIDIHSSFGVSEITI